MQYGRSIELRVTSFGVAMSAVLAVAMSVVASGALAQANRARGAGADDWSAVEQSLGRKGAMNPGGVMKFAFPRSDLQVMVNDVQLKPALALGGWVAFKPLANGRAMALGVLQTALHNHVQSESPRVMYMHIMAEGDRAKIAETLRAALGESKTPMTIAATDAPNAAIDLDTAAVAHALGYPGKVNGGVYQVSVPRAERIVDMGQQIPPSMGVATAINFQPTGGGKAAITGDFVLVGREVNPVLRALRDNGIQVTAVHSHMLQESPRLFFMHFWANDDATKLAAGLHAALARTNVKRS